MFLPPRESRREQSRSAASYSLRSTQAEICSGLSIDDTNGAGPENISIDTPENTGGSYYRVGVHYYSSGDDFFGMDYGPSDATIRVYLLGLLSGEWTQRLQRTGNFWEVAGIEWGNMTSRVVEINRVYDSTP